MPKRKASVRLRTLLEKGKATDQQIFNELSNFMIERNINKHSVTKSELMKFFNCSGNRATRLLGSFVQEGKLTKDQGADDLYWLVVE